MIGSKERRVEPSLSTKRYHMTVQKRKTDPRCLKMRENKWSKNSKEMSSKTILNCADLKTGLRCIDFLPSLEPLVRKTGVGKINGANQTKVRNQRIRNSSCLRL